MHNKIRDGDVTGSVLEFVKGEQKMLSQCAAYYRRLHKEQARRTGLYVSDFNGVSPALKDKLNLYFDVSVRGRACVCACVGMDGVRMTYVPASLPLINFHQNLLIINNNKSITNSSPGP